MKQTPAEEYLLPGFCCAGASPRQNALFGCLVRDHGYFLGELLGAYDRKGEFGGSFENRTKALLAIVDGIRERLGDSLAIAVRLNAFDSEPYPEGWGLREENGVLIPDLEEPVRLCRMLSDR